MTAGKLFNSVVTLNRNASCLFCARHFKTSVNTCQRIISSILKPTAEDLRDHTAVAV